MEDRSAKSRLVGVGGGYGHHFWQGTRIPKQGPLASFDCNGGGALRQRCDADYRRNGGLAADAESRTIWVSDAVGAVVCGAGVKFGVPAVEVVGEVIVEDETERNRKRGGDRSGSGL